MQNVREHPNKGVYVEGLTSQYVSSYEEVMDVITLGDSARAVASTNMNASSSRSHSVFIIQVTQKTEEGSASHTHPPTHPPTRCAARGRALGSHSAVPQALDFVSTAIRSTKTGKLNLVDLAGSEKVGKTGAQGETLEEAKKINQSLSALGQVRSK